MTKKEQDIERQRMWTVINDKFKEGRIAYATFEGIVSVPFKEFLSQPVEGILYDLNRSEVVIGMFLDDPGWVNDFAMAKTVRALYAERQGNERLRDAVQRFCEHPAIIEASSSSTDVATRYKAVMDELEAK